MKTHTIALGSFLAALTGSLPAETEIVFGHVGGKTWGELAGDFWNWAWIEPCQSNPISDETGEHNWRNQAGPVWFLAGSWCGDPVVREVTIPPDRTIFIPIWTVNFTTDFGETEEEAREAVQKVMADALQQGSEMSASIDGVPLDGILYPEVTSLQAISPGGGYTVFLQEGSCPVMNGATPGAFPGSCAGGYWIAVKFDPGTEHILNVNYEGANCTIDVTHNITIEPRIPVQEDLDDWSQIHFGSPWGTDTATADADPDGDLACNLLEFAFNMNPMEWDNHPVQTDEGTSGTPAVRARGPNLAVRRGLVEYVRRRNSGITYIAEFSSDLVDWEPADRDIRVTWIDDLWERVIALDPKAGEPQRFGRVRVVIDGSG